MAPNLAPGGGSQLLMAFSPLVFLSLLNSVPLLVAYLSQRHAAATAKPQLRCPFVLRELSMF